jgi:tetratricopeptide (TPR) repeat protein
MTDLSFDLRLALLERELTFADQAEFDAALTQAQQLASRQPTDQQRLYYAQLLCCVGELRLAIEQLDRALEHNKQFGAAYAERGLLYGTVERYDLAMLNLANAIHVQPSFHRAWSYRAGLHLRRGMWGDVVEDATQAIELAPDYPPPYKLRAIAHEAHRQTEKAIADFSSYIAHCPTAPDRVQIEQSIRTLRNPPPKTGLFDRLFGKR